MRKILAVTCTLLTLLSIGGYAAGGGCYSSVVVRGSYVAPYVAPAVKQQAYVAPAVAVYAPLPVYTAVYLPAVGYPAAPAAQAQTQPGPAPMANADCAQIQTDINKNLKLILEGMQSLDGRIRALEGRAGGVPAPPPGTVLPGPPPPAKPKEDDPFNPKPQTAPQTAPPPGGASAPPGTPPPAPKPKEDDPFSPEPQAAPAAASASAAGASAAAANTAKVDVAKETARIVTAACASCHESKVAEKKGKGLVLLQDGKLATLSDKQARRVATLAYSGQMPPPAGGHKLTDRDVGVIMAYVDSLR